MDNRPSSSPLKFDTHIKQRVAHKSTSNVASLLKDLEHKKQSMSQALSRNSAKKAITSAGGLQALKKQSTICSFFAKQQPPKKPKISKHSDEDEEEMQVGADSEASSSTPDSSSDEDLTIGGERGTKKGTKAKEKNDLQVTKSSPKSEKERSKLTCSTQAPSTSNIPKATGFKIESPEAKKAVKLPPPPPMDFMVRTRAVLISSEDEEDSKMDGQKEKKPINNRNAILVSDEEDAPISNGKLKSDEEETEWLSVAKAKSNDGEKAQRQKKTKEHKPEKGTLKALKLKVEKLRKKKGKHGGSSDENEDASDSEDGGDVKADSFESDDSDTGDRLSAKQLKLLRQLETKCVEFCNQSSREELAECEKFNDRFISFVLENRPFSDFKDLKAKASEAPSTGQGRRGRGNAGVTLLRTLESYLDWLENRGILDRVLDDCKEHSKAIEKAVEEAKHQTTSEKLPGLNPDCSLHPYQQAGLNWLIMMNRLGLNAILADEMGLGKTIQVIAFLAWAKDRVAFEPKLRGPHLIVVPSSTIENWMQEIAQWAPSLRMLTYYGSIEERQQLRHSARKHEVDLILTTYNMVISKQEDRKFFKRFSLNYVIYDEGHMLRNCATNRYANLMRVRGKRKILLTGTPLQNNLIELISLLYFTSKSLFDKYCEDIQSLLQMFALKGNVLIGQEDGGAKGKGVKNKRAGEEDEEVEMADNKTEAEEAKCRSMYEQHKVSQARHILAPFVLRRLKIEVLSCLPKKHEHIEYSKMVDSQAALYAEIIETLRARRELREGGGSGLDLLMQMRQVANHPLLYRRHFDDDKCVAMAKALCKREKFYEKKQPDHVAEDLAYMSDIALHLLCRKFERSIGKFALDQRLSVESGKCRVLDTLLPKIINDKREKVLIFSQFTSMLDVIELYLNHRDYEYLRLDGSTPVLERQQMINTFNKNASIPIFLLSTKAGGLGINLTAANNIIIHDIDFNPYNDKQAEDRCHRMGQKKDVHVIRLIAKDTVEEQMLALALQKLELERNVTTSSGGDGTPQSVKESGTKVGLAQNTMEELLRMVCK